MDRDLLGLSLAYHGSHLLNQMRAEQQLTAEDVNTLKSSTPIPVTGVPLDDFDQRVAKFIAKKADLLFYKDESAETRKTEFNNRYARYCAVLPPLDFFMEVSRTTRRQQLFRNLDRGDIVVGVISAVRDIGFTVTLLALSDSCARDIAELKLTAFCPLREIPKTHAHENALEAFSIKDKVRAVVLSISEEKIIVSLQRRALTSEQDISLGLITDEELPAYCRAIDAADSRSYGTMLREAAEFRNPSDVSNMASAFGLNDVKRQPSLMRGLFRVQYKETDYADKLRKDQSHRLAMRSVADGVDHFKHGRTVEAMQMFNKALQVDNENVEALVARGALYANSESYKRALEDFDAALAVNPNHTNARKYACDTLLALGRSMLENGDTDGAISRVYRASLLQPNRPETVELLAEIQRRMLNADAVETVDVADDIDTSTITDSKELAAASSHKDVVKKRRGSTMMDEIKTRKKHKRTASSSSSDSSPSARRERRVQKQKRRGSGDGISTSSDSVVELEWIPRGAETHTKSALTELVGCAKSDARRGYDVSLVNPERTQNAAEEKKIGGENCDDNNQPGRYGPPLPPGEGHDEEDHESEHVVTKKRTRSVSSSSSSSSSGSSSSSKSSSNSSSSDSRTKPSRKNDRKQKGGRHSDEHGSIRRRKSDSRSSALEIKKRNSGRRSDNVKKMDRRRSKGSSEEKRIGDRRRSSQHSTNADHSGRARHSTGSSDIGHHGNTGTRGSWRFRGMQRQPYVGDHGTGRNRKPSYDNGSFDATRNRRRSESAKARVEDRKSTAGKSTGQNSSSSSSDSDDQPGKVDKSAVVKKVVGTTAGESLSGDEPRQTSSGQSIEGKTGKCSDTLEDMEAFLKQLKAQSKLKTVKK